MLFELKSYFYRSALGQQIEECCQYFEEELLDLKQGLAIDFNKVLAAIAGNPNSGSGNNDGNLTSGEQTVVSYFTNLL